MEEEFICLTGKHFETMCKNWERYRLKVIDVAAKQLKGSGPKEKIREAKQAGESFKTEAENLAIFELLLHLLPNTNAREMVKGVITSNCLSLIFHKFDVGSSNFVL
jgi:hypothetical protein